MHDCITPVFEFVTPPVSRTATAAEIDADYPKQMVSGAAINALIRSVGFLRSLSLNLTQCSGIKKLSKHEH